MQIKKEDYVNHYFYGSLYIVFSTEKERFELSRRKNPTYTLSRGASSAS